MIPLREKALHGSIKTLLGVLTLGGALCCLFAPVFSGDVERGYLSIYYRNEKVGYEEYTWTAGENGFELSVQGKTNKPVPLDIENLAIRMDSSFLPSFFHFKGSIMEVPREVTSTIVEGAVNNKIFVAGEKQSHPVQVRRDAFLLPNPMFAPYMAITKKFRCSLTEPEELSAYIIPQLEMTFTLEPMEESPCMMVMRLGSTEIFLKTDEKGSLLSLTIPTQHLKVVREER